MKNKKHLAYIASFPCYVCENPETIPHHLLEVDNLPKGVGRKNGDEWAIALCNRCHTELHDRIGDEVKFFEKYGIDHEEVKAYAIRLWSHSVK